jgi:hypothetical protein
LTAPDADLYFQVRAVKRAIAFKNPVVDFSKVLFIDMPFPQGREWPHETQHRVGYMAVPGLRSQSRSGQLAEADRVDRHDVPVPGRRRDP